MQIARSDVRPASPAATNPRHAASATQLLDAPKPGWATYDRPVSVAPRRPIRVLIVDDDRTLREGCASVLRVDGFDEYEEI